MPGSILGPRVTRVEDPDLITGRHGAIPRPILAQVPVRGTADQPEAASVDI
jgi:hypothetical protein